MEFTLTTPVAFLIFNRPAETKRVFESIRRAKPPILLIVADGPRTAAETRLCNETRAIVENIDWPCDVRRNYSDVNLGCKQRVSSGLSWVFREVERAIVLEDDCLPHPTFFRFCQELLEHYQNDERVMHISGDNFQHNNPAFTSHESYYFTNVPHIWGWASWRRAWARYDVSMSTWPQARRNRTLAKVLPDEPSVARWTDKFQNYYEGKINSWDGQWSYACLINNALCICPSVNLISNIGFSSTATHSSQPSNMDVLANLPVQEMKFPLFHPPSKQLNTVAVNYVADLVFGVYKYRSWSRRLRRAVKRLVGLR